MSQLSVVICTYNRVKQLSGLIRRFDHDIMLPDGLELEVLIVDNHSTDSTRGVVEKFIREKRDYTLNYTLEEKSGLSNARNRGIRKALFERICFLDDDVVPGNNFLSALQSAFHNYPSFRSYALRVNYHPVYRPSWYRLRGKYRMLNRGGYDLGPVTRPLTEEDPMPMGAAMVFSKTIFRELGEFDTRFGYDAKAAIMVPGEETEMFLKMLRNGVPILFVHDAAVDHYPTNEKWDLDTLSKIYVGVGYWYGSRDARKTKDRGIISWAGFPRSYYKRLFLNLIPYLITRFFFGKTVKYYYLFQIKKIVGQFEGFKAFR